MSFIIETSINYEAKTRTALRSTTADIDTFLRLMNFDSKFAFLTYYFNIDTVNLGVQSVLLTNLQGMERVKSGKFEGYGDETCNRGRFKKILVDLVNLIKFYNLTLANFNK